MTVRKARLEVLDPRHQDAQQNLEIIRTLMERATRYEHLSARTGLQVGLIAIAGSLLASRTSAVETVPFLTIWGGVFLLSLAATIIEQAREVRRAGVDLWTRPAREILRALLPALVMAGLLTVHASSLGRHLELPGLWMLCYGCGALATSTFAPPVVASLGAGFLVGGGITLWLGPAWSNPMMGLVFGAGHLILGLRLVRREPTERRPKLTVCEP